MQVFVCACMCLFSSQNQMNSYLKWDDKQEITDMCRSPYRGRGSREKEGGLGGGGGGRRRRPFVSRKWYCWTLDKEQTLSVKQQQLWHWEQGAKSLSLYQVTNLPCGWGGDASARFSLDVDLMLMARPPPTPLGKDGCSCIDTRAGPCPFCVFDTASALSFSSVGTHCNKLFIRHSMCVWGGGGGGAGRVKDNHHLQR